jgi:hypothetical protein
MSGLVPGFPLDAQFRVSLAEKCIGMGFAKQAGALIDEVERIGRRYRVPYLPKPGPSSHAATREEATTPPIVQQEARLRERARETGVHTPLLWFLGTLGRMDEVRALRDELSPGADADRALAALLLEDELTLAQSLELLDGLDDPPLYHALLKQRLRMDDRAGAWAAVEAGLAAVPHDVSSLNLLARYLSRDGDARLGEAIERSLAIAPQQQDIAALRNAPFTGEIYLGTAPKLEPVTFYLPAYNVERYIRDTIEHVFLQDYPITEFFVVNDGSQDASVAIAREYPVTILHHAENLGLAAARNTALVEARGAWLLSVDTDARPEPPYVRSVMLEAETRDKNTAAIGGMLIEDFQEAPPDKWRARVMAQQHGPVRQCPPWFLYGSTMCIERAAGDCRRRLRRTPPHQRRRHGTGQGPGGRGKAPLLFPPRPRAPPAAGQPAQRPAHVVELALLGQGGGEGVERRRAARHGMLHGLNSAGQAMQRFIDMGDRDLWYIAFLLVVHDPLCDLAQATKFGLLHPGEGAGAVRSASLEARGARYALLGRIVVRCATRFGPDHRRNRGSGAGARFARTATGVRSLFRRIGRLTRKFQ